MNVIIDSNKSIRTVKENSSSKIEDVVFYLSKEISPCRSFVTFSSDTGFDTIQLEESSQRHLNYSLFVIPANQMLSIASGHYKLWLDCFTADHNFRFRSEPTDIDIDVSNFSNTGNLSYINQVQASISDKYKQIEEITKLNLEILEEIKKLHKEESHGY